MPSSSSSASNAQSDQTGITTPEIGLFANDPAVAQLQKQVAELQFGLATMMTRDASSQRSYDASEIKELLRSVISVTPQQSLEPGNEDRMVSEKTGFCFIPGEEYKEKTWWKAGLFALAAPGAIEAGKVPLAAIGSALSNVNSALSVDAKSRAQSWWDTATGFGSKIGDWTSGAISEASKAISSIDNETLTNVGMTVAGTTALAGAAYGAYGAYKYMTGGQTEQTLGEQTAMDVSVKSKLTSVADESLHKFRSDASTARSLFRRAYDAIPAVTLPGKI